MNFIRALFSRTQPDDLPESRFPDLHGGEDTRFVWAAPSHLLLRLPDHSFFVGMVHAGNTSPKKAAEPRWHACATSCIHSLLDKDLVFYRHWAESHELFPS